MARVYANLVRLGLRTLDQIFPEELREQVKKILEEEG